MCFAGQTASDAEAGAEGVVVLAGDRIVDADAAAARLFGAQDPAEMLGRSAMSLFPPSTQGIVRERLERLLSSRHGQALFDQCCQRLDGSLFDAPLLLLDAVPWAGAAGVRITVRLAGAGNDAMLGDPLHREALLRSILATAPDGVIVIDGRGIMRHVSARVELLFGYAAAELVGRNVAMLMPSPYREHHDAYIARYLATGERRIIGVGRVASGQRKDGTTFPIELAVSEATSGGERLFTGFVRDLSAGQERERRLHELQAELIHVSRLSELGQMVSALAHEVNQPLMAIDMYLRAVQRLCEAGDQERAKASLEKAAEQAARAGEIVRRLRGFVRKETTGRRMEPLPKVIEEAAALSFIGLKGRVDFAVRLAPAADTAYIDRTQIQQVLVNLMRNAIEAMPEGEKRSLSITTERLDEEAILIAVADTGPGLDPAVRAQLFQPFVTTKTGGIGVGLSICRSIIEAHGGRIWAEDNPAGGTVFQFTLPRSGPEARSS